MQGIIDNDSLAATNIRAGNFQDPAITVPGDSFCGSVTYHLKQGNAGILGTETPAPDGSTEGRDALRFSVTKTAGPPGAGAAAYTGVSNATGGCIDIARSSSGPRAHCSGTQTGACDLSTFEYYAYAVDGVTWASTSPNAPASLTQAQVQGIYNCTFTDWSAVGGSPGHITRVLPQNGSGTLSFFLSNVLGVSAISALPTGSTGQTTGCTPIIQAQENEATDLYNGANLTGTNAPFSNAAYSEAILPYSGGKWSFQAGASLDPTIDHRGGARPGALVVAQGTNSVKDLMVRWTGTAWVLNDASVVGSPSTVHTFSGKTLATHSIAALTTTSRTATIGTTNGSIQITGTFSSSDANANVIATGVPPGDIITAVTQNDGVTSCSSACPKAILGKAATATGTPSATLGLVAVTVSGVGTDAFDANDDLGASVTGTNIGANVTIAKVNSATSANLSIGTTAAGATNAATLDNTNLIQATGGDTFSASDVGGTLTSSNLTGTITIKSVSSTTRATLSTSTGVSAGTTSTTNTITGQVRNVSGIGITAGSPTVTAAASTFVSGDVGKILDNPNLPPGAKITGVAVDGSSATLQVNATFTAASQSAAVGFSVVSEGNVNATSGAFAPYPGARFVYNVIDSTEPDYLTAQGMVGFDDGGTAKSPLCSGADSGTIKSFGFIPLVARTSPGGNTGVTCVKKGPS
jgi:hypothetical protein